MSKIKEMDDAQLQIYIKEMAEEQGEEFSPEFLEKLSAMSRKELVKLAVNMQKQSNKDGEKEIQIVEAILKTQAERGTNQYKQEWLMKRSKKELLDVLEELQKPVEKPVDSEEAIADEYDKLGKKQLIEEIKRLKYDNALLEKRLARAKATGYPRGMSR